MTYDDTKERGVLGRLRISVRYHQRGTRFFDTVDSWTKAISVLAGTAAVTILWQSVLNETLLLWVAAVITLLNTFSLVFGFSAKARLHADLVRRYLELESAVVGTVNPTTEFLASIDGKIRLIEAEEPPTLGALVTIAQNEIARQDGDESSIVPVGRFRWLLAHFIDFEAPKPPRSAQ